ncbi:Metallothionein expression activator [Microbotryomycetes sp. JL221]|nr:Metallothionein expression activator [Microbotryomycetes sp. JL221]
MTFYLNSEFDQAYLAHSTSASDENLAAQFGLDSSTLFSTSSSQQPNQTSSSLHHVSTSLAQDSPRSFPAYDPDSPFNSALTKAAFARDGRLKNRLMGIGSEGGYLTSPLIVGNRKGSDSMFQQAVGFASPAATPDLGIHSPAAPEHEDTAIEYIHVDDADLDNEDHAHDIDVTAPASTGAMGMGITGVGELQKAKDMGGAYTTTVADSTQQNLGRPSSRGGPRTRSVSGGSSVRATARTTRSRAAQEHFDETITVETNTISSKRSADTFNDSHFPKSPPMATIGAPPATGRRPKKPLPLKTINRAKSCSALSPIAQQAQQAPEPLTPVSARSMQFLLPGVPYNSPADDLVAQAALEPSMFSFSDLYNFELTTGSGTGSRKSSNTYAGGLLSTENASGLSTALNTTASASTNGREASDYLSVHQLPTPYLAPSGFSSPGTEYVSDPSPELGMPFRSPTHLSSASMLSAPSMESNYSLPLPDGSMHQQATIRQRAITHDGRAMYDDGHSMSMNYGGRVYGNGRTNDDVPMLAPPPPMALPSVPQSTSMQHRQLSSMSAYGPSAKFAYPSRYMHPSAAQAPAMSWAHSVPPSAQQQSLHQQQFIQQYANVDPAMFIPPYEQVVHKQHHGEVYERNLEAFDDMYERYGSGQGVPSAIYATPGKRVRTVDDDDVDLDYEDGMGGFQIRTQSNVSTTTTPRATRTRQATTHNDNNSNRYIMQTPEQPAAKKLRTVASAPCLPTKRMRPGPKPKPKSPGQQHESVFSTKSLSPKQVQLPAFARALSPFSDGGMGDDMDGGINDRPRGSVPKEVIESLYRGVPTHLDENGDKVPKRYFCLMEGCDRTFPRKSAIESHIQTHLEDKPYVCTEPDCDASFVRQHDLRRHSRIHSDHKPFACPCGKGFARGDALARHRARGICSGSVVPRKD